MILLGHEPDRLLLSGGYGVQGVAVGLAAAELHLDDHEGIGVTGDDVHLPAAGAVVALDDLVSLAGQVAARDLLPEPARGPVIQPPTPA